MTSSCASERVVFPKSTVMLHLFCGIILIVLTCNAPQVEAHGTHHRSPEPNPAAGSSGSHHPQQQQMYSQEGVSLDQAKIRLEQLRSGRVLDGSEEKHIREHLEQIAKLNEGEMTEEERALHFFYLHDMDSDTRLDGLEILHSIMEVEHEGEEQKNSQADGNKQGGQNEQKEHSSKTEEEKGKEEKKAEEERDHPRNWSLNEIVEHIDSLLRDYDKNNDGYIDFYEFKEIIKRTRESREAEEEKTRQQQTSEQTKGSEL
ncbi:uncharacterized protein LOC142356872 [Convolutriloba macropyga]|uniref:uncharacterized protein LOC142356872 n=1 Tax=Convolutriloba macropyga TaxID=536237 RepID=UPI003F52888C